MKKGWEFAYCVAGEMNFAEIKQMDNPRLIPYKTGNGILGDKDNFVNRSEAMLALNKEKCYSFISMESENGQ